MRPISAFIGCLLYERDDTVEVDNSHIDGWLAFY